MTMLPGLPHHFFKMVRNDKIQTKVQAKLKLQIVSISLFSLPSPNYHVSNTTKSIKSPKATKPKPFLARALKLPNLPKPVFDLKSQAYFLLSFFFKRDNPGLTQLRHWQEPSILLTTELPQPIQDTKSKNWTLCFDMSQSGHLYFIYCTSKKQERKLS